MRGKVYIMILIISILTVFVGVYQMYVYDGIARVCYTDLIFEHKGILTTEEIVQLDKELCGQYWTLFRIWKYVTFSGLITSIVVLVVYARKSRKVSLKKNE